MKFWQLLDIFRDEQELLTEILEQKKWLKYFEYYKNIEVVVAKQDRKILDQKIDSSLLTEVTLKSKKVIYYAPSQAKIYSYPNSATTEEIHISEAIKRFDHDTVEDVFEKTEANV